jgi:[acyl-carrier-protein] S-malonyltransferase
MKAFVFPGQAAQFSGMGKDIYEANSQARLLFEQANEIIGFDLASIMFEGSEEQLKQTNITQPSVFVHSVIKAKVFSTELPDAVAGHSLGEFSALVAANSLSFEDGLLLVQKRANSMQEACELNPGTMAAILGLDDSIVDELCKKVGDDVVAANFNCPGQLVISGSIDSVKEAMQLCTEAGAKRAILLQVGGAFHSPLMKPAQDKLEAAIASTNFKDPDCPIFQNYTAMPSRKAEEIKLNLINQLTSPVLWTKTIQNMIEYGINHFTEVGGTGTVIRGMIRQINREIPTDSL